MFADIISVYNGNIKHMGRGLKPLALERALQSFPVHPYGRNTCIAEPREAPVRRPVKC